MCTSLVYRDMAGKAYFGRTLELTTDLPYQMVYLPTGFATVSQVEGHSPVEYAARHALLAVTMPARIPTAQAPLQMADLKVLEGLNDQGLTFSLLSYPTAAGKQRAVEMTRAVLSASDLGTWVLGQFSTVEAVKAALAEQPVMLVPLAILGGVVSPFHYVVHDTTGASLVVEFENGEMRVYDNPVGVMTNGPQFSWHLTNLNNYTFLSNVDQPSATFGAFKAMQPDSGIATAGLPGSNTSVGRFVRAAYYAQYTEKAATPDLAVVTLGHVLNVFDRPRGATIDYPHEGGGHLEVEGLKEESGMPYATEFTSWTSLADLDRKLFFLRTYGGLNYTRFDLPALAAADAPRVLPFQALDGAAADATAALLGAKAP